MEPRHPLLASEMPGAVAGFNNIPLPFNNNNMTIKNTIHPISTRSTAHLDSQLSRGSMTTRYQQQPSNLHAMLTPTAAGTRAHNTKMLIQAGMPYDEQ